MNSISRRAALAWLCACAAARPALAGAGDHAPALVLATSYRPGIDLRDWWVSEKYDGVRAHWDGARLRTRGGDTIAAPTWFTAGWPATPLDGELWAGRGAFAAAQAAVARQQPDDAPWRRLRYMVFDLPAHSGRFDQRLAALQRTVTAIAQPWVQAVPQRRVANDAELQALLREVVRGGGEGLMLRRGSSLHIPGRGDDLLKLKPFDDAEARVLAHLPGQGRHAGRLGALLVETPEGLRFRLGSGFSDAERANPPPVGSWVTYRYRGTHAGSRLPRFASFLRVRRDEARWRTGAGQSESKGDSASR